MYVTRAGVQGGTRSAAGPSVGAPVPGRHQLAPPVHQGARGRRQRALLRPHRRHPAARYGREHMLDAGAKSQSQGGRE
eukprot:4460627-Pyramimonas_sp.AAC.1